MSQRNGLCVTRQFAGSEAGIHPTRGSLPNVRSLESLLMCVTSLMQGPLEMLWDRSQSNGLRSYNSVPKPREAHAPCRSETAAAAAGQIRTRGSSLAVLAHRYLQYPLVGHVTPGMEKRHACKELLSPAKTSLISCMISPGPGIGLGGKIVSKHHMKGKMENENGFTYRDIGKSNDQAMKVGDHDDEDARIPVKFTLFCCMVCKFSSDRGCIRR